MSYGTIEHLQRELHPAFEMQFEIVSLEQIQHPPILGQLKQQTKVKRNIRKALTPEQQKAFLQFMDGHQYMNTGNHFYLYDWNRS